MVKSWNLANQINSSHASHNLKSIRKYIGNTVNDLRRNWKTWHVANQGTNFQEGMKKEDFAKSIF